MPCKVSSIKVPVNATNAQGAKYVYLQSTSALDTDVRSASCFVWEVKGSNLGPKTGQPNILMVFLDSSR
jgi:hypothetical protein